MENPDPDTGESSADIDAGKYYREQISIAKQISNVVIILFKFDKKVKKYIVIDIFHR